MRARTGLILTTVAGLVLVACGSDDPEPAAGPAPTVTVTETVTADPTSDDPTSDDPTADASPEPTTDVSSASSACDAPGLEQQAFIFVTTPTVGADFSSGDVVEGCANVFEAAFQWEVRDSSDAVLASGNEMASCGTGCVGVFSFSPTFTVSSTETGTLRVFASSAEDGSDVYVNQVPVLLQP